MWFDVHPVGIDYLQRSPFQFRNEAVLNAPAGRVFDVLVEDRDANIWFKDFVACRFTSPPPHGVGTTRDIELKALTVKERFLVYEPGKRLAFCIYASTLPILREMAEDIVLTPLSDNQTRFTWTVHYTPVPWLRPVHSPVRKVFGGMFRETSERLARYLSR